MNIPVLLAKKFREEGMVWSDVAQEIAWATGRKFAFDSVQRACNAARRKLHLPVTPFKQRWIEEALIEALWSLRLDTYEIARALRKTEAEVAKYMGGNRGRLQSNASGACAPSLNGEAT